MRSEEDDNEIEEADEDAVALTISDGDSTSSDDDTDRDVQRLMRDFDINIPTTHEYLGKLDHISGYSVYEHGQVLELPAVCTNTLAFPGFTMPLVLKDPERLFVNGCHFVLVWLIKESKMFFEYGVVMEVFERGSDNELFTGRVTIKARGRHRCFILPQEILLNSFSQMLKARVRVLEETPISSPISCTQLDSLRQRFPYHGNYSDVSAFSKYRKMHLAQFVFPHFVYDLYEVDYYVDKIIKELYKHYSQNDIPTDPTVLSYWFGQNYQLMNSERLMLLQANTTLERLRFASKYLQIERNICCNHCHLVIGHQRDVIAMSKDGLQNNYVNPGGVVYETVTIRTIQNFALEGTACRDFSWFPGYAWTITKCKECYGHLGWMFTSRKLQPSRFFGLALSCISIKKCRDIDSESLSRMTEGILLAFTPGT